MSLTCLAIACRRVNLDTGRLIVIRKCITTSACLNDKKGPLSEWVPKKPGKKGSSIVKHDSRQLDSSAKKGSLSEWISQNYDNDGPKDLPKDPDQLDHFDRIAKTSKNKDYDYHSVVRAAQFFDHHTKDWDHFKTVIDRFKDPKQPSFRIGQVEFIYGAMKRLRDYGLNKDIRAYNALLSIFPRGRMIPTNPVQFGFMHYAKQQYCATDLFEEAEWNQVLPNQETVDLVDAIFGRRSHVFEKVATMIYWITKARYSDPYPMPNFLPLDPKELAKISFRRMCVDLNTQISVFSTEVISESIDKTWVMSAMSPVQKNLLEKIDEPLFIEGPHISWLKDHRVNYFVLKTAPLKEPLPNEDEDDMEDMRNLPLYAHGGLSKKEHIEKMERIHKTPDGIILGMCATGTSSRDSLLSWVRILQQHIPKLNETSIVFTLKAPETGIDVVNNENDEKSGEESPQQEVKKLVNK